MHRFLVEKTEPNSHEQVRNQVQQEIAAAATATQKGSKHNLYFSEEKAAIGRYAAENGNYRAVRKFSSAQRQVPESTVRGFKRMYLNELKKNKSATPESVVRLDSGKKIGRPVQLGPLDKEVQEYIKSISDGGRIINKNIVKAAARGIVKYYKPSALSTGSVNITDSWAKSL